MKFKAGSRVEADGWKLDGEHISSPEKLAAVKEVLQKRAPF
jgi:hypothetical protein